MGMGNRRRACMVVYRVQAAWHGVLSMSSHKKKFKK